MLQFVAESISCLLLRQLQSPLCCYECRELKLIYLFIFKPFSRSSPPASLNLVQCSAEAEEGEKSTPNPMVYYGSCISFPGPKVALTAGTWCQSYLPDWEPCSTYAWCMFANSLPCPRKYPFQGPGCAAAVGTS